MENPGRGDWASDFQNDLPGQGRPADLPSGRIPRQSGDKDSNAGALLALACPQHRGDSGGGKPPPHPRCARCDMLVPRRALNGRYLTTAQCARGEERKRRRLAEAEARESSERAINSYRKPIKNVSAFRYLGRVLMAGDDDWLAVIGNLGKARKSWGRLSWVLGREGADPKVSGNFIRRYPRR